MRKILKVILPSVFFLAFGIATMTVVMSCSKDDGSKCSDCDDDTDCDSGLDCYLFTNGDYKCVENAGDLCVGL
jgi:hypothetical protein